MTEAPKLGLADKVIANIMANPSSLDMAEFVSDCGTKACLAGHICLVGSDIPGLSSFDDLRILLQSDPFAIDATARWHDSVIPSTARALWAREYGEASAARLPFYADDFADVVHCLDWDDLVLRYVELSYLLRLVPELDAAYKRYRAAHPVVCTIPRS